MHPKPPDTALRSVTRWSFLRTWWPWRSLGYLATTAPVAGAAGLVLSVPGLPWLYLYAHADRPDHPDLGATVLLILLGAALLGASAPLVAVPLAVVERARLPLVDRRPLADRPLWAARRVPPAGLLRRAAALYTAEGTWRAVAYTLLLITLVPAILTALLLLLLTILALLMSPFAVSLESGVTITIGPIRVTEPLQTVPLVFVGLLLLAATGYLAAIAAGGLAAVARLLLRDSPDGPLRAELVEINRSRARLVDTFEAERRRIERDLHDGAQQRLVSLTLQLGLARLDVPADSPAAHTVAAAHDQAKQLMGELRELIHGIYPQVLTDLGLSAAIGELADRSPVPVNVTAELTGRLPAQIEVATYFMVAEALTNVAKHSGATRAAVALHQHQDRLVVEVGDNGRGGADPQRGSGLTGLADRVAVSDGRMFLSSPVGGPTLLRLELPCQPVSTPFE